MAEPQSPTIEQLPKMPSGMQTEVAQRAGLKHVETTEKNVLPSKEDMEEEKKHENLKKGIQEFDKNHQLRHVEAEEKSGGREGENKKKFLFIPHNLLKDCVALLN
jgi:hypothetical protein